MFSTGKGFMKLLLVNFILLSCVLPAAAFGHNGYIGMYTDQAGFDCDTIFTHMYEAIYVYFMYIPGDGPDSLMGIDFRIEQTKGPAGQVFSVATEYPPFVSVISGDFFSGISLDFSGCQMGFDALYVGRMNMLVLTDYTSEYEYGVVEYPGEDIQVRTCYSGSLPVGGIMGGTFSFNGVCGLQLLGATAQSPSVVLVEFSEELDPVSAVAPSNYVVYETDDPSATLPVANVILHSNEYSTYALLGTPLTTGVAYTLGVEGVLSAVGGAVRPGSAESIVTPYAPSVEITSGSAEDAHTGTASPEFCWRGSSDEVPVESLEYAYRIDSGALGAWSGDTCAALSGLAEGAHTFEVRVRDSRSYENYARRNFTVDITAPGVQVVSGPEDGGWGNVNPTFIWTGTDNISPVDSLVYSYRMDGDPWSPYSHETDHTFGPLPAATYTFSVRSRDLAGNVSAEKTVTFTVDLSAPETYITSGPADSSFIPADQDSITYEWTGSDDNTGTPDLEYSYKLDGSTWTAFRPDTSYAFPSNFPDGLHTFNVKARDRAMNEDQTPEQGTFMIDHTGPTVTFTSGPAMLGYTSATPTLAWIGGDNYTPVDSILYSYSDMGSAFSEFDTTKSRTFGPYPNGQFTYIQVRARDLMGNVGGSAVLYFIADAAPPETYIWDGPAEGEVIGPDQPTVTFMFYGNDTVTPQDDLVYSWRLDDGAWSDFSEQPGCIFSQEIAPGTHIFQVVARDTVLNVDQTPAQRSFVIDRCGDHSATLTLFADMDATDCDVDIPQGNAGNLHLFYVRNDGPVPGKSLRFRLRFSTAGVTVGTPTWNPNVTVTNGTLTGGILVTADTCLGTATDSQVHICTIPVMNNSDPDSFTVDVVEDPTAPTPGIYFSVCGPGDPECEALGGTIFVNSPCRPAVVAAEAHGLTSVDVSFNGALDQATAEDAGNYAVYETITPVNTVPVTGATLQGGGQTVVLALGDTLYQGTAYSLAVSGVEIEGGYPMEPGSVTDIDLLYSFDTTPPETWITSGPAEGELLNSNDHTSVTFEWSGDDDSTQTAELVYSYRMDSEQWTAFGGATSYTFPTTDMYDGIHNFYVRARDASGNIDPTPDQRSFLFLRHSDHSAMLALFADTNAVDCDADILPGQTIDLRLYYVRNDGPPMGVASEFRLRLSTAAAAFATPVWRDEFGVVMGDVTSGISLAAADCLGITPQGDTLDAVYLGTVPVFCAGDTDTFMVDVVEDPNATPPPGIFITLCEENHPRERVMGGTFVFNGNCQVELESAVAMTPLRVDATFDMELEQTGAETASNYEIYETAHPGMTASVVGAALQADGRTVLLTLADSLHIAKGYTLEVMNIEAADGTSIMPGADVTVTMLFEIALELTSGPAANEILIQDSAAFCWRAASGLFPPDSLVYSHRLDGGAYGAWSADTCATLSGLGDGSHLFEVRTQDPLGNAGFTQRRFYVDITGPVVIIESGPAGGGITGPDVAFEWSGTDNFSPADSLVFSYRMDGDAWSAFARDTMRAFTGLADGDRTFQVRGRDLLGNVGDSAAVQFTVDTTPPETGITAGPAEDELLNSEDDPSVTFGWSGSDDRTPAQDLEYSFRLDNEPWSDFGELVSYTFPTTDLNDGTHNFFVRARDAVGNIDPTPIQRTFLFMRYSDHGAMLALFADTNATDCDADILPEQTIDLKLFYVRNDGPPMGAASEFRLRLSTTQAAFMAPVWREEIVAIMGDVASGISLTASDCLGITKYNDTLDVVFLGTVPVFCAGDTDTFMVDVVEDPNATPPPGIFITRCEENHPRERVMGGTFVFNGQCRPELESAVALTSLLVEVTFDAELEQASAENVSNYGIHQTTDPSQTVQVTAAVLQGDQRTVALTLADSLFIGTGYTLAVENVKMVNGHTIPPGSDIAIDLRFQISMAITSGPDEGRHVNTTSVDFCYAGSSLWYPTDNLVYSYRVDADAWSPWSYDSCATVSGLADGGHTFEVCVRDPYENSDCTVRSFLIDTGAPETELVVAPTEGGKYPFLDYTLSFIFTGSDDYSPVDSLWFSHRVDAGAWSEFARDTLYELSGLSSGPHTFEVRARDLAGNIDQTPSSASFVISPSATVVGGEISSSTTWSVSGSPYIVTSDIVIVTPEGMPLTVLTIEPHVEVRFEPGIKITVGGMVPCAAGTCSSDGALYAVGAAADSIRFTTNFGSIPSPLGDDHWNGIHFSEHSSGTSSVLRFCLIEYAGRDTPGCAVRIESSSPTIEHCSIVYSKYVGVLIEGSATPLVWGNDISGNFDCGLIVSGPDASPTVSNNDFRYNRIAINCHPAGLSNFGMNSATGNTNGPLDGDCILIGRGDVMRSSSWPVTGLPYRLVGAVGVVTPEGQPLSVLTVEPGVRVECLYGATSQLVLGGTVDCGGPECPSDGALHAVGTPDSVIVFTSGSSVPEPGDWGGIIFTENSSGTSSELRYCVIEYGGDNEYEYASITIYGASPTVASSTVRFGEGPAGIYITGGSDAVLTDNLVTSNVEQGLVVDCTTGSPTVVGNTFTDNGYAGMVSSAQSLSNFGLNTVSGNGGRGDRIVLTGESVLQSCSWPNVGLPYVVAGSGIQVLTPEGQPLSVLTIEPGVEIQFEEGTGLGLGGTVDCSTGTCDSDGALHAVGTADSLIVFTSAQGTPAPGDWKGIDFSGYCSGTSSMMQYCVIEYGGSDIMRGNLHVDNAALELLDHLGLYNSEYFGMVGQGSSIVIHNSSFVGNALAGLINSDPEQLIDAEYNWWGHRSGPSGSGPGSGQSVGLNIDYDPWLLQSPMGDQQPPEVEITAGPAEDEYILSPEVTFAWAGFDDFSPPESLLYAYRFDGDPFSEWTSDTTASRTVGEGAHTFEVKAQDTEGRTSDTAMRSFSYDGTPPSVELVVAPEDGGWVGSADVSFEWTGSDNVAPPESLFYSYSLDDDVWSVFDRITTKDYTALAETTHVFMVKAQDPAGNTGDSTAVTFTIDTVGPDTWITDAPIEGDTLGLAADSIRFAWSGDDDMTLLEDLRYSYRLDEGQWSETAPDTEYTTDVTPLGDGVHTFMVKAVDLASNEDGTPAERSFLLDLTPPVITFTSGPGEEEHVNDISPAFCWTASDAVTPPDSIDFSYRVDAGAQSGWSDDTCLTIPVLDVGVHYLTVWARDMVENTDLVSREFTVDDTPPVPEIVSGPEDGGWGSQTPAFEWTGTDAYTPTEEILYTYCMDDGPWSEPAAVTYNTFGPLSDTTHVFMLKAADLAGNVSDSLTVTFDVDLGEPGTEITAGPGEGEAFGTPTASIHFAWIGSDDNTPDDSLAYAYRLDGDPWSEPAPDTAADISTDLSDGSHTFMVKAIDLAGNEDSTPAERGFAIDRTPPEFVYPEELRQGEQIPDSTFEFCWAAIDNKSPAGSLLYPYTIDGEPGPMFDNDTCITLTGLGEDVHTLIINAIDEVGNIGELTWIFVVDLTPPAPEIVSGPEDGGWSTDSPVFEWTAPDNFAPVDSINYSYRLDTDPWSEFSFETSREFGPLVEAEHLFMLKAQDLAGNVSDSVTVAFTVDVVPPETWVTGGPDPGGFVDTSIAAFAWTGSDDNTPEPDIEFSYKMDILTYSSFSRDTSAAFGSLSDGGHLFIVRSRDMAGNIDPTPDSLSFIVDALPPTIVFTGVPGEDEHINTTETVFEWEGSDLISPPESLRYAYRLDGDAYTGWSYNTTGTAPGLAEGAHTFTVRAIDQRNHVDSLTRSFTVDLVPPEPVITGGPGEGDCWPNSSVSFDWTGTDDFSAPGELEFAWEMDGGGYGGWTGEGGHTFEGLAVAPHTLALKARDRAGNESIVPAGVSFVVGRVDLVVTTITVPDSAYCNREMAVSWTVLNQGDCTVDGAWSDGVYLSIDGAAGGDVLIGEFDSAALLAPGDSVTVEEQVLIPDDSTGTYYLVVETDHLDDVLEEGFDDNNTAVSAPFVVTTPPHPDLRVASVTAPSEGWSGRGVYIDWTVENAGQATAPGGWTEYVYMSTDTALDGDDYKLSEFLYEYALGAGASYSHTHPVTFPVDTVGYRYILVDADAGPGNDVSEYESEDNNLGVSTDPIHIRQTPYPNLQVESIETQDTAFTNQEFVIGWIVTNTGGAPTSVGVWYDKVYLSTTTDPGGYLLGEFENLSYLDTLESYHRQDCTVTIPKQVLDGNYYIVVTTDCRNNVYEHHDEGDNALASVAIPVVYMPYPRSDLEVTYFRASSAGWAGAPIEVSWKVKNVGNAATESGAILDWVYLSSIPIAEPDSAVHIGGNFAGETLEPDSSYERTVQVTLPTNASGLNYLFVWSDIDLVCDDPEIDNNFSIVKTIEISVPLTADLVVTTVTASEDSVVHGTTLGVQWRVENVGAGPGLVTAWHDGIYLSEDDTLVIGSDQRLARVYHSGSLDPLEGYNRSTTVTIPSGLTGTYHIFVSTDCDAVVPEENFENNNANSLVSPIVVTAPPAVVLQEGDLRVSALGVPAEAWSGTTMEITWAVRNHGPDDVNAASWKDYAYLSADTVIGAGDDLLASPPHYGGLTVNATYTVKLDVSIDNGLAGPYFIIVKTDADGKVYEPGHEGDNTAHSAFAINLTPPPDLRVTELISADDTLLAGEAAAVQWMVRNDGAGGTVATYWVDRFYLSVDSLLSGGDTYIGAYAHSGALEPGQFYQQNRSLTIPSGYQGLYYLIALADADNQVYEHQVDGNNMAWTPVTIELPPVPPPPDLAMDTLGFIDGLRDTLLYRVQNISANQVPSAERSWTDRFYLSVDSILSTAEDDEIASYSRSGDLAPGAAYSRTAGISLPPGTEGAFYLFGVVDVTQRVTEEDETNNTMGLQQVIELTPPDLAVADIRHDASLTAGQPVQVAWTVENTGTGPCDPESWYDGIYLSVDLILDQTDYNLGSKHRTGGLETGISYDDSMEVAVPQGLSGTYYFFIRTDKNEEVYEHGSEDNNIFYALTGAEITIPPPDADLVVTNIQTPAGAVSGDSVTIGWTVTNQSDYDLVGQWKDAVYISSDDAWDLGDTYLGDALHTSGLAAGGRYVQALTIAWADYIGMMESVVPGLVPGGYRIIVRADIRNNIIEFNEANNIGSSADSLSVDVQELVIDVPDSSAVRYKGQKYYGLNVPAGHDVRFFVDCHGAYDELRLFISYGEVPDRITYDYTEKITGHEELIIPGSSDERCYIMVYGDYIPGSGSYTILAESFLFGLTEHYPSVADNSGFVTFTIIGGHLDGAVAVRLEYPGGGTVEAWDINPLNSTKLEAGFDLRGAELGVYDLVVAIDDPDTATAPGAVQIVPGEGAVIEPDIKGPISIRKEVIGSYTVSLTNIGDADAYDVITGLTVDPNNVFQLVMDDTVSGMKLSFGEEVLVYSSFIGVGATEEFTVRVKGMSELGELNIEVLSVHTEPLFVQSPSGDVLLTTWVDNAVDAFGDGLEDNGVTIDRGLFRGLHADAWRDRQQLDLGEPRTGFLEAQVDESILAALVELADPLVPADRQGITNLGLAIAEDAAQQDYLQGKNSGRFKSKKKTVTVRIARDPNEKLGPTAPGEDNFITQIEEIPYTVYFENMEDAQATAREVLVVDPLDSDLDWRRFRLGEIAFGDTVVDVPPNRSYYHTTVELETGFLLEIDAGVSIVDGEAEARWIFTTIDPATGQLPFDPGAGFLPPNDSTGRGEGHVFFTIKADPEAPDGTEITNKALIVFDANDPIETDEVVNVIRRVHPDLIVSAASGYSAYPSFIEGEEIAVVATVGNPSEAGSGGFTVAFFDGDPYSSGVMIGSPQPVAGLAGNGEEDVEVTWMPVRSLAQHDIHIVVDHGGAVTEADEDNNRRILVLEPQPKTYTVSLDADINLVSLPLEPLEPYTARSFAGLLGASQIIRYDTTGPGGMFETFVETQPGDGFDIVPGEGYIAVLTTPRDVTFTGITQTGAMDVEKGLNFVSLPLDPDGACYARSMCTTCDANMLIRYVNSTREFDAFIPDFHSGGGFEVLGARGYLAVANDDASLQFEGTGWIGVQSAPPGGYLYAAEETDPGTETRVLGLTGSLVEKVWNEETPLMGAYTATATNNGSGVEIPLRIDPESGCFSGAFVDFTNNRPVLAGDAIEIVVTGEDGKRVGDPVVYTVSKSDVKRRYAGFKGAIEGLTPSVTRLYQNFPNPFNPVTRIRFQLAGPGRVNLKVYNVAGQLVRTLVSEHRKAGYFEVEWKGANNNGHTVSSGVYFCRLETPGYTRSMKMVILR